MKFAHEFTETLTSENFPADWQAAAIQYRQLKKCIKRVQRELAELGLNVETLKALIQEEGVQGNDESGKPMGPTLQYMFDGTVKSFQPKLVLKVHKKDGIKFDLGLSEETRRSLEKLMQARGIKSQSVVHEVDMGSSGTESEALGTSPSNPVPGATSETQSICSSSSESSSSDKSSTSANDDEAEKPKISTIEIPLSADNEFFQNLTAELLSLEKIQTRAATTIESEIVNIGDSVTSCAAPKTLSRRSDLYPWREIFRIYLDTSIFFSSLEIEQHKERTVEDATARLQKFNTQIVALSLPKQFKNRNSRVLLARFLKMNEEVLRVLRFQAINKIAVRKILKKFDKRTALNARTTFPPFLSNSPFLASNLAKAICYTMSTRILTIIPQLDDYLCPICQCISIKPVRLSCSHVFCVRCLVKLQREVKDKCPMCRGGVVMKADATNLDVELLNFLKSYFPVEAREKQKDNEREVVLEQWKNVHQSMGVNQAGGCVLM